MNRIDDRFIHTVNLLARGAEGHRVKFALNLIERFSSLLGDLGQRPYPRG